MMSETATKTKCEARQIIMPIGQDKTWLEARKAVKEQGGLPSNLLHDRYLVETEDWKTMPSGYYGAWAREVVVYPAKNGIFTKGKDVIDGTWIFPASQIPEEVFLRQAEGKKMALFVDPLDVEEKNGKVTILTRPESVIVLGNFLQADGWGIVNERTRMPLEADLSNVPADQQRYLWRRSEESIRPVARGYYGRDYDDGGTSTSIGTGTLRSGWRGWPRSAAKRPRRRTTS